MSKKKMFYTEEKALYFANQSECLHVNETERPRNTDLWQIVKRAERDGFLIKIASDDSGDYFKTTKFGDMRLLELQIAWRESHRRDATEHRARLESLRAA